MSLVDEAREVRERIAARLRELEPLVAEYNELRKVAVEMGIDVVEPAPAAAESASAAGNPASATGATKQAPRKKGPPTTRRPRRTKSAGRSAATAGRNDEFAQRVLRAVREQPGKTVAEYAVLLALSPATLYRPARELTASGAIVKRGRQLFPARG